MQAHNTPDTTAAHAAPQPVPARAPLMWAVVEMFGHQRLAGAVSEQPFGGGVLMRVDVPEVTVRETVWEGGSERTVVRTIPAHSRSLGTGAVYSINWCDELTATSAACTIKHEPLRPYSMRAALAGMPEAERQRLLGVAGNLLPQLTAEPADTWFDHD